MLMMSDTDSLIRVVLRKLATMLYGACIGQKIRRFASHDRSIYQVCMHGVLDIVKAMAERTHVDLEAGVSLAGHHCTWQHTRVASLWFSTCASRGLTRRRGNEDSYTPLHLAALGGHLPVAQYLCEQGADKEARGDGDNAPLHWVAQDGQLPVVQYSNSGTIEIMQHFRAGKMESVS